MSIGTITVKDLGNGDIWFGKDCHLCGEPFTTGIHDADTICPKCKELWKKFVESRERIEE